VWVSKGGYEYNLVLLADVFAISDLGPGKLSLDHALGTRRSGAGWAIAQLLAGAAGSWAATTFAERQPALYTPDGNGARGPEPAKEPHGASA
jgi:putative oxidoreductase